MHYSCLMFQLVFLMMWGFPLITLGMGLSSEQAGAVLAINTVVTVASGPLHGMFSARLGATRHWAVVVFSTTIVLTWVVFFATGTPRGMAAIVVVNVVVALCAASANYGFDNVREGVSRETVATATGLANMGGFLSGMAASQGIGIVLDISADGAEYSWTDFQLAALAGGSVWAVGIAGLFCATAWRTREIQRVRSGGTAAPAGSAAAAASKGNSTATQHGLVIHEATTPEPENRTD